MSFAEGLNAGTNLVSAVRDYQLRKQALADHEAEQRLADQRDQAESDARVQLQRMQAHAYQQSMDRADSDMADRAELYRLARERLYLEGMAGDIKDHKLDKQMYLSALNWGEKPDVDPMNDGRYISRVDTMPNGNFVYGVSGPTIDGTQPLTMNRGTAADGDNTVYQQTPEQFIHDHLGRSQALAERAPELAKVLDGDPKQLSQWVNQQLLQTKMRMAELGYNQDAEGRKAADARELEDLQHKNKMAEIDETAKQRTQRPENTPDDLQLHNDIFHNYKENGKPVTYERAWDIVKDLRGRDNAITSQRWNYVREGLKAQSEAGLQQGDPGFKSVDDLVAESQSIADSFDKSGGTAQPKNPYAQIHGLPPAETNKGRVVRDKQTGLRYQSDGMGWKQIQDASPTDEESKAP